MRLEEAAQLSSVITSEVFHGDDMTDFPLYEARFAQCSFSDCVFDSTRIGDSHFLGCRFKDCSFRDTELTACSFHDAIEGTVCTWTHCDLSEARFLRCDLSGNKLAKGKGFLLTLGECSAVGLQLDLDVHRRVAGRTVIGGVRCTRTKLSGAVLRKCDLEESRFEHCDLREVDFSHCSLIGVSFQNSVLNHASFLGAVMNEAIVAHAMLEGFDVAEMQSYDNLVISRDQQDTILNSLLIRTVN